MRRKKTHTNKIRSFVKGRSQQTPRKYRESIGTTLKAILK
jgi:hypothetical protein